MNKSLLALALLVCVVTAGCAAQFGATPSPRTTVSASDVTVTPGEPATARVEATNVAKMRFSLPAESPGVDVAIDDARVTPNPGSVAESYPPLWMWDHERAEVTAEVPVRAAENATAGTYRYPVTVWNASDRAGEGVTANVTVTVES